MGNWQNWLRKWERWWNISDQSQTNPTYRPDGPPFREFPWNCLVNCSAASLKHTLWRNISAGRFVNVGETLLKDNVQGDHGGLAQTLGSGPIKIPALNREFAQNHHGHLVVYISVDLPRFTARRMEAVTSAGMPTAP